MKSRSSSERRRWRNDVKSFKKELLQREEVRCNICIVLFNIRDDHLQKAVKEVLGSADVILSTITGASPEGSLRYDVIDWSKLI